MLVSEKDTMASTPGAQPSKHTRFERNGYTAEVVISDSALGSIYHYVIQRDGSPELLHCGQEVSMQRALECIHEFIDKRSSRAS